MTKEKVQDGRRSYHKSRRKHETLPDDRKIRKVETSIRKNDTNTYIKPYEESNINNFPSLDKKTLHNNNNIDGSEVVHVVNGRHTKGSYADIGEVRKYPKVRDFEYPGEVTQKKKFQFILTFLFSIYVGQLVGAVSANATIFFFDL